jgi:hypothetical protein
VIAFPNRERKTNHFHVTDAGDFLGNAFVMHGKIKLVFFEQPEIAVIAIGPMTSKLMNSPFTLEKRVSLVIGQVAVGAKHHHYFVV